MKSLDEMLTTAREAGLRITPQRRLIFGLLAGRQDHPTAEDLYEEATAEMPDLSRGTVYNTLRQMVDLDLLAEVDNLSVDGARYDTEIRDHHHVYCMGCGKLIDVDHDFEGIELPREQARGYRIVRRQVTFYGYCPECQPVVDSSDDERAQGARV